MRLLTSDILSHLTRPTVHLLAEIVIPLAVRQDFNTVFTSTQLVTLPVIWLSDGPVPKKAGQNSSSHLTTSLPAACPSPQESTALEEFRGPKWGLRGGESGRRWLEKLVPKGPVEVC
jgi:hypothetical protein